MMTAEKTSEWSGPQADLPGDECYSWTAPTLPSLGQDGVRIDFCRLPHVDHLYCGFLVSDTADATDRGTVESSRLHLLTALIGELERAAQAVRALRDRETWHTRVDHFPPRLTAPVDSARCQCGVRVPSSELDIDGLCRGCHNAASNGRYNDMTGAID